MKGQISPFTLLITSLPGGGQRIAIIVSVRLFVCLFVCLLAYLKFHMSKFHRIFSTCYLWPWLGLLWRQCDKLRFRCIKTEPQKRFSCPRITGAVTKLSKLSARSHTGDVGSRSEEEAGLGRGVIRDQFNPGTLVWEQNCLQTRGDSSRSLPSFCHATVGVGAPEIGTSIFSGSPARTRISRPPRADKSTFGGSVSHKQHLTNTRSSAVTYRKKIATGTFYFIFFQRTAN